MGADPVTAGLLGLGIVNTVMGGVAQGRQAEVARAEAARQAGEIKRQAARDRERAGAELRRRLAAARVGAVGAGIDAGSGSALEVLAGTAGLGALDLAAIEREGGLRAAQALQRGREAAYGYSGSAAAARARGSDALLRTGLTLGGTVLGQGARVW
jgi:hypothetical protein